MLSVDQACLWELKLVYPLFSEVLFPLTARSDKDSLPLFSEQTVCFNETEKLRTEQVRRIQHLRNACDGKFVFTSRVAVWGSRRFYFSKEYNFIYCKVPKAGSTFWIQLFNILETGPNAVQRMLGKSRYWMHHEGRPTVLPFKSEKLRQTISVLVSRNPYTRLFSAFIDIVYMTPMKLYAKKDGCVDITFREFLNSIVEDVRTGRPLNRHWAPIYSICLPCILRIFALVKLESFSSDVEFTLKRLGVDGDKYKTITDKLRRDRFDITIIPRYVNEFISKRWTADGCRNKTKLSKGIWATLQMQGLIKDTVGFPNYVIDTDVEAGNGTFLIKTILKTVKEHPLTSEQSKLQRRRALIKAYAGISKSTINEIKRIFKPDFILFEYSDEPPSWTRVITQNIKTHVKLQVWRRCPYILRHWAAYSWARPAILVAGKGGCFYFFCFFTFIRVLFLPCPSLSSLLSLLSLFSFSLGDDTKWPTWIVWRFI